MLHVMFTANPSYPLLKSFENSLDIKATLGLLRFIFLSYSENSKRERIILHNIFFIQVFETNHSLLQGLSFANKKRYPITAS